jgi:hypothetical protein
MQISLGRSDNSGFIHSSSASQSSRTPLLRGSDGGAPSGPRLSCCAQFKVWSLRAASVTAFVLGGLSIAGTIPSGGAGAVVGGLQLGLGATLGGWARSVRLKEEAEVLLRHGTWGGGGGTGGGVGGIGEVEIDDEGGGDRLQAYTNPLPQNYYQGQQPNLRGASSGGAPTNVLIVVQGDQPKPEPTHEQVEKIFQETNVAKRAREGLAKLSSGMGDNSATTRTQRRSSDTVSQVD